MNPYENKKVQNAKSLVSQIQSLINNGNVSKAFGLIENDLLGSIELESSCREKLLKGFLGENKRTRLMFFYPQWLTGGIERTLVNLWTFLLKFYDIYFISCNTKFKSVINIPDEIIHIKVSDIVINNTYDYTLYTLSILFNIDVAIGCMSLFKKAMDFYKLAFGTIKTISSNHGYYFDIYENASSYSLTEKRLDAFKYVDAAVWLTNFNTYVYNNYNDNGCLIENSNTYSIRYDNNIKKDEKIILCVGRFNDYVKRIDRVLNCFEKVLVKIPDAKLMLLGKCDKRAPCMPYSYTTVEDIINELNIPGDSIYFVNEASNMEKYYSIASILLITSNSEGFPMVLNEAACFGVPVVCNYIPGLEDIILDGENGFFTPQDDIDSMADRICELLSDEFLRMKMGEKAKELAKRYELDVIGEKWRLLIDTIVSNRSREEKWEIINKKLGVDYKNINLYAKNLCNEIRKLLSVLVETSNNCKITNQNSLLLFHYLALKNSYHKYGLKKTLTKIFNKIIKKIKWNSDNVRAH